ncbi:MAG: hypothetical protein ACREST_04855 [Steroidobacteraceae bacterium]
MDMGFRILALSLVLVTGSARADSADLDWLGLAYFWAADIGVDVRDRSVNVDFSDVVDKLEIGFQGHVEAQADDFGGFVDVVFMGLGDNSSRPLADLNADFDMTAMDLALVWSPGPERMTGIELYGGLRYIDMDLSVVVDPVPPGPADIRTGIDKSYTDFLAGARYLAPLNEHWRLTFSADLSGGDTEGTWSVGGFAGYRTGPHHFIAGYRHLEMEFEADGGDERAKETFSGPLIAYGFSF